eukprot:6007619-Amphidinium_carterae.1
MELSKEHSKTTAQRNTQQKAAKGVLSTPRLVWEHYYHGMALAEALSETGLAGVVCPTLQDLSGPGVPWLEAAFEDTRSACCFLS